MIAWRMTNEMRKKIVTESAKIDQRGEQVEEEQNVDLENIKKRVSKLNIGWHSSSNILLDDMWKAPLQQWKMSQQKMPQGRWTVPDKSEQVQPGT